MGIHILEEILIWLPVKSLFRFKCVSESWRSLISEPYFNRKHLNHGKNHDSRRKVLISQRGYGEDHSFTFYTSSLSSVQLVKDIQRLDWPLNSKPHHARVCCCYDGLFLIGIWSKVKEQHPSILLLWNPSTRESIVLSHSELPPIERSLYGLGYDSTSNDYKVVRIDEYHDTPDEILVLKSGSWKKIDETSYKSDEWLFTSYNDMDGLAFVHGALHWLGWEPRLTLVSFNISNEMCGEIPLPKIMHSLKSFAGVSVLGGMLCVHYNENRTFNLWVMKDYDVEESWIKSFTISNNNGLWSIMPIYRFSNDEVLLCCLTDDGTVLRTSDGSFRLSNRIWPSDGDVIDIHNLQDGFVYTESLISPKLNH